MLNYFIDLRGTGQDSTLIADYPHQEPFDGDQAAFWRAFPRPPWEFNTRQLYYTKGQARLSSLHIHRGPGNRSGVPRLLLFVQINMSSAVVTAADRLPVYEWTSRDQAGQPTH